MSLLSYPTTVGTVAHAKMPQLAGQRSGVAQAKMSELAGLRSSATTNPRGTNDAPEVDGGH